MFSKFSVNFGNWKCPVNTLKDVPLILGVNGSEQVQIIDLIRLILDLLKLLSKPVSLNSYNIISLKLCRSS